MDSISTQTEANPTEEVNDEPECSKKGLSVNVRLLPERTGSVDNLEITAHDSFTDLFSSGLSAVNSIAPGDWRSLVPYLALPEWLRDNSFLWNYHRPPLGSVRRCMASIFRVHSETGNIWTHLLGWIAIHICAIYAYAKPLRRLEWSDKLIFGCFVIGAWCCLLFSWSFHVLQCHSPKVFLISSRLDYLGVSLLIMTSFFAWVFYAFYCHRVTRTVYILVMLVIGLTTICLSLWKKFSLPRYRALRGMVFLVVALYGIIPLAHAIAIYGSSSTKFSTAAVGQIAVMGSFYLAGVFLYSARIPERFFPGKCDLLFQSHQAFHVCVVIGALLHGHDIVRMAIAHAGVGGRCK